MPGKVVFVWLALITPSNVGSGRRAKSWFILIHEIGNDRDRIDGDFVAVNDAANNVAFLIAEDLTVQECGKGALTSGAIVVRQVKFSLVTVLGVAEPGYLRDFAFNADVFG